MLGRRRERWANIKTTLDQRIVFAGITLCPDAFLILSQRLRCLANVYTTLVQWW